MKIYTRILALLTLIVCSTSTRANVLFMLAMPSAEPALVPWHKLEVTFNVSADGQIGKFKLVTPDAVNTSTQFDSAVSVGFKPSKGSLKPDEIWEKKIENVTPEHDSVLFHKWKRGENGAFDAGVSGKVTYVISLYYKSYPRQTLPLSSTPLDVKSQVPIDYLSPAVVSYYASNGFQLSADGKRLATDGWTDVSAITKLFYAPISYGGTSYSASGTASRKVGDCGGQANLFVAGCRLLNIPARTNLGWLIREKGMAPEKHARAEFQQQGEWYPAEITGFRTARQGNPQAPLTSFIGTEGNWSPHFFTMMYGNGMQFEIKDRDGEYTIFGSKDSLGLQTPWFKAYGINGEELQSRVTGPVIRVLQ